MELFIWPGDNGVPSIDLSSLQMLAYCKFNGVPIKINPVTNSWRILNHVPLFTHGYNVRLKTFKEVVDYLKRQNYNSDHKLVQKDKNDVKAYTSVIAQKLDPAVMYLYWGHENNYVQWTRPWFAKRMPFPVNLFLPDRYQKQMKERLTLLLGDDPDKWMSKEKSLLDEAEKCITLLSQKLSDNDYFFGDTPTSFDAYVFSYLSTLLVPLPSLNPFRGQINSHTNLIGFIARIKRSYFPDVQEEKPEKVESTDEYPNRWLDITLSSLFAATVMLSYAYFNFRNIRQ